MKMTKDLQFIIYRNFMFRSIRVATISVPVCILIFLILFCCMLSVFSINLMLSVITSLYKSTYKDNIDLYCNSMTKNGWLVRILILWVCVSVCVLPASFEAQKTFKSWYSQLITCLTFIIEGAVWRTKRQVRFLCPWARYLTGLPLPLSG